MVEQQELPWLKRQQRRLEEHATSSPVLWTIDKGRQLGDYQLLYPVSGSEDAAVYYGVHKDTKQEVAIKKTKRKPDASKKLGHEIAILQKLDHQHIIKCFGGGLDQSHAYLVMPLAKEGDLFEYVNGCGKLEAKEALRIFKQLTSAVNYLHGRGYIHRDLKLENVLLDENRDVLLGDFGYVVAWTPFAKQYKSCGSFLYAAPELLAGRPYTGPEADIWSLGVCLYVMLTGCFPFTREERTKMTSAMRRGKPIDCRLVFAEEDKVPAEVRELLSKMMREEPLKRATMLDVLSHPWMGSSKPEGPAWCQKRRRTTSVDA